VSGVAGRETLSRAEARRVALAAQGLDRPRPRRPGAADVSATLRRLGVLQLDFVNVGRDGVVPSRRRARP